MSFYENRILPHVINAACGSKPIMRRRNMVVPHCEGRVLEVGMGSGINLPLYDASKVEMVWGLEPSEGMRRKAQTRLNASDVPVTWLDLPGESIPLDDNSADTVLLTFTLCTIPGAEQALSEMRRVLKPGGTLLFCEHGLAPDKSVQRWQHRINPVWKKIAGGCHVNRDIPALISNAGFNIQSLQTEYAEKTPKIAGFLNWGSAGKRA